MQRIALRSPGAGNVWGCVMGKPGQSKLEKARAQHREGMAWGKHFHHFSELRLHACPGGPHVQHRPWSPGLTLLRIRTFRMSKLDLRASRFAAETGATEGKDMRPLAWGTPQRDLLENKPGLSWCVNPVLSPGWAHSRHSAKACFSCFAHLP